jgi:hypothetical protein
MALSTGLGDRNAKFSTRLLRYAIRRLGARMTESRAAGISAFPLVVAPLGASVQTGLVIGRRRDGGRGVSVAFLGGSLGLRQAHGSLRSRSKTRRQGYQQNAQHKAHEHLPSQLFVPTHNPRTSAATAPKKVGATIGEDGSPLCQASLVGLRGEGPATLRLSKLSTEHYVP